MRLFGLAAIAFMLASGCAFASDDDNVLQEARDSFHYLLKDPTSAQYEKMHVIRNAAGAPTVCGEVNARNSSGGYVGFRRFSFDGTKSEIVEEDAEAGEAVNVMFPSLLHYYARGCAGPERQDDMRSYVAAVFNCGVIWSLEDNVINQHVEQGAALDQAIGVVRAQAEKNQRPFPPEAEQGMRAGYAQYLAALLGDEKAVESVKNQPAATHEAFRVDCEMRSYWKARRGTP